jgi:O-antigen ligase
MVIGIDRFKEHPVFGEGLATSGPAYRYVTPSVKNEDLYEGSVKAKEDYYIPESWYVQQLVEGGIPALLSFAAILCIVAFRILPFSTPFFAAFVAACLMNFFLHTFESAYASLMLFAFAGLFIAPSPKKSD